MTSPTTLGTRDPEIFAATCGTRAYSANLGADLVIVDRHHLNDGYFPGAREVLMTSDGRSCDLRSHEGPPTGEPVYFEVARQHRPDYHGWLDSVSRRIIQVG